MGIWAPRRRWSYGEQVFSAPSLSPGSSQRKKRSSSAGAVSPPPVWQSSWRSCPRSRSRSATKGGRKKASPDHVHLLPWNRVTINWIVYFLSPEIVMDQGIVPLRIASFNLETEEWRAILRAPLNMLTIPILDLSVASLNGCLVVIHYIRQSSSMDLWFLMDFDKGLWAKQYSIPLKLDFHYKVPVWPLLVLNDGRILYYEEMKSLRIYDPKTCTSADVAKIGPYNGIGLYTGNLLSLPDGAGV